MALQYYNSLFPAITPPQLPAFDYTPRSRNEITNTLSYNSFRYTFSPSIANVRSQIKGILIRVVRGDTNSNAIDDRIFSGIPQLPYRALYNTSANDVGYDQDTGEYYVDIPVKYLLNYTSVGNAVGNLSSSAAVNSLGYTLADGKVYIKKTSWVEVDENNFNYSSAIENMYYKIQIRLFPFEIRKKSGSYTAWQFYNETTKAWVDMTEDSLNEQRNIISEYSTVTSIKAVYRPRLELTGAFRSRDASGNWQQPYFNKDDIIIGDGINDSVNIINSPFFNFTASYSSPYNMQETLSKYKFTLYKYVGNNPFAGDIFGDSGMRVVQDVLAPNISWDCPIEFITGNKFWLELYGETKYGLVIRTMYILDTEFPPISGSVGFEIKGDDEYARNIIDLDGRQLYFEPADGVSRHEFVDTDGDGIDDSVKIIGTYESSKNIELYPDKAWISQMVITGVTPTELGTYSEPGPVGKPFFVIKTDDISVYNRFSYKYELRAYYQEIHYPYMNKPIYFKEVTDTGKPTGGVYAVKIEKPNNRIESRRTYTQGVGQTAYIVRDSATNANWELSVDSNNRIVLNPTDEVATTNIVYFRESESSYGLSISNGRVAIAYNDSNDQTLKRYDNKFELIKYSYDRNADINMYPDHCILTQVAEAKFLNDDWTLDGWDKISPDKKYYFYIGDFEGDIRLYVKQMNGTHSRVDEFNEKQVRE